MRILLLLRLLLLWLAVASLLTDVNFFALLLRLGTAVTLLLSDSELLLDVGVAVLALWCLGLRLLGSWAADGGSEGFVDFFVTFPSV